MIYSVGGNAACSIFKESKLWNGNILVFRILAGPEVDVFVKEPVVKRSRFGSDPHKYKIINFRDHMGKD